MMRQILAIIIASLAAIVANVIFYIPFPKYVWG